MNREECLICKAPLEYLLQDEEMECAVCHRREASKTRCVNGHYVCNNCHTQGMDSIFGLCLAETSADPIAILRRMMDLPFCHMHGPEHHVMVGAALLTAYHNAGGALDLEQALPEMLRRGSQVPAAWGNAADDETEKYAYDYIYENCFPLEEAKKDFLAFLEEKVIGR